MATETISVRVTGRVQGVGFRAWMRQLAEDLGISGWVRNEADGSVAALISGEGAAVARMLERLRDGPPMSRVAGVETAPGAAPEGAGFVIAR